MPEQARRPRTAPASVGRAAPVRGGQEALWQARRAAPAQAHQQTPAQVCEAALGRRGAGRVRPGRRSQGGGVRLTRRGRIVITLLLAGLALLLAALLAARAQAASSGMSAAALKRSMTRMVVQPGETLWSIAVRAEPAADPRVVVQQIIDINGLPGTTLLPGEQLWVPRA